MPPDYALPTLDSEIALLAARRDRVERWLLLRLRSGRCTAEDHARYLAVLAQVAGRLSALFAQRAQTRAGDELDAFLAAVARRVQELSTPDDPTPAAGSPAPTLDV